MTTWSRAYHPLRLRTLLPQLLVLLPAEVLLLVTHPDHDAGFQWAPHFLVAMTMGHS